MKIIGLTGQKRSGKDTVAGLIDMHSMRPWRVATLRESFAGPIRRSVAEMLGWSMEELEEHKELPLARLDGVTPRHMMQTLGTEWGRKMILDDLWIRLLEGRLEEQINLGIWKVAVITDVRFENEAKMIKSMDGIIVRVVRPGLPPPDGHSSETPLPDELVDATIVNDATIPELSAKVGEFMRNNRIPH